MTVLQTQVGGAETQVGGTQTQVGGTQTQVGGAERQILVESGAVLPSPVTEERSSCGEAG